MDRTQQVHWAKQLRPLHLDAGPIAGQLRQRLGVVLVVTGLLLGLSTFFVLIFAGFGRWDLGLLIGGLIWPFLLWIWWDHLRLRSAVERFRAEQRG